MSKPWITLELATDFTQEGKPVAPLPGKIVYINDIYQVNARILKGNIFDVTHLSIKRRDKEAHRDWRHYQQIKNELCGHGSCAIEVYPPEEYLVDTANQYHLWVFPNADLFPFIFKMRLVSEVGIAGAQQRKFQQGLRPTDLTDPDVMEKLMGGYKIFTRG